MTGSSAAALTGLMFVVISVVTGQERSAGTRDGVSVFSTPTVMHFASALLMSAILVAPWDTILHAAIVAGSLGLCGLAYLVTVTLRTRRLGMYKPDLEDWAFYTVLPFLSYAAIAVGALALGYLQPWSLFAIALGVVLLIFIGIRNAWDVVTFITIGRGAGS